MESHMKPDDLLRGYLDEHILLIVLRPIALVLHRCVDVINILFRA